MTKATKPPTAEQMESMRRRVSEELAARADTLQRMLDIREISDYEGAYFRTPSRELVQTAIQLGMHETVEKFMDRLDQLHGRVNYRVFDDERESPWWEAER